MDKTSRFLLILVLVVSSSGLARAQAPPQKSDTKAPTSKAKPRNERQKPAKEEPEKVWLERAERLTAEIHEEEWRLGQQRPLLLARLALVWWRYDRNRARHWMDTAVSELEFQPQNESVADGVKRIRIAETVLGIVMPVDRTYADRLLKVVTEGTERLADSVKSPEDRLEFARIRGDLPRIAYDAVHQKNLDSAERAFRTLLKIKEQGAASILRDMWSVDAKRAEALYTVALESTKGGGYDPDLIFGLGQVAYPMSERRQEELPPEALRQRFLDFFAEAVLRVPQSDREQKDICEVSRGGDRLIDEYLPDRRGPIRAVLDDCKRRWPLTETETNNPEKKLETAEDYLEAAEKDPDAAQRGFYKSWAARLADRDGQGSRALEIIRSYTQEEREGYPQWGWDYQKYETGVIAELYKRHDLPALQTLMDTSPRRPQTLVAVANKLFAEKDESFGVLILSEARRAIEKTQLDESLTYWSLLSAYARRIPAEAGAVFKEVVIGLNGIRPPVFAPNAKFKFWWFHIAGDLRPMPMAWQLLDLDPQYVSETIKLLESVENRTAIRLSFLSATLGRYEREKWQREQKRQADRVKTKGRDSVAPSSSH